MARGWSLRISIRHCGPDLSGHQWSQCLATHASCAALDQLGHEELLPGGIEQHGCALTAVATGSEQFTSAATPADSKQTGWLTVEATERMEVVER